MSKKIQIEQEDTNWKHHMHVYIYTIYGTF